MRRSLLALALLVITGQAMALELNTATVSELEAAGFSPADAQTIYDATHPLSGTPTTFTSSKQLLSLPGITQGDLNRVRANLTINGQRVTTRSGTAPAIPGVSPAIPAKKATLPEATDDNSAAGNSSNKSGNRGGNKGGNGGGNKGGNGKGNN
ncbi:hypothetical protein [Vogesella oryzae]|uniref:hypothetical protein n=1 Tax=Vogesella oryzae TaxID=1735285 RepID=UPI001582F92C|nr:hypothetical protein [Vogesella oryzae]